MTRCRPVASSTSPSVQVHYCVSIPSCNQRSPEPDNHTKDRHASSTRTHVHISTRTQLETRAMHTNALSWKGLSARAWKSLYQELGVRLLSHRKLMRGEIFHALATSMMMILDFFSDWWGAPFVDKAARKCVCIRMVCSIFIIDSYRSSAAMYWMEEASMFINFSRTM